MSTRCAWALQKALYYLPLPPECSNEPINRCDSKLANWTAVRRFVHLHLRLATVRTANSYWKRHSLCFTTSSSHDIGTRLGTREAIPKGLKMCLSNATSTIGTDATGPIYWQGISYAICPIRQITALRAFRSTTKRAYLVPAQSPESHRGSAARRNRAILRCARASARAR
jgi:hypothetical protein